MIIKLGFLHNLMIVEEIELTEISLLIPTLAADTCFERLKVILNFMLTYLLKYIRMGRNRCT